MKVIKGHPESRERAVRGRACCMLKNRDPRCILMVLFRLGLTHISLFVNSL